MNKFTLVYDHLGTIHSNLELPLYQEYFNVEQYQVEKTYNPKTTLYYTDALKKTSVHDEFLERGFQIVYDGLQEPGTKFDTQQGYILHHQNYFWFHDSLLGIAHGHCDYQPQKTYKKLALMPMNLHKQHRTQLLERMSPYLDKCYWSYVSMGRQLPFDIPVVDWQGQRYFEPRWYNDTYFSMVAESRISPVKNTPLMVTEKTFKAIAHYHPFLIWAETGILQHLKSLGFETFDNLFDESYDIITNSADRLKAIINNVSNFEQISYDRITLEKLQHNHDRFFDQELVTNCIKNEIIQPLIEYIEEKL
jgi:hypothetical protein